MIQEQQHDRGQVAASAAEIYEQFFVPALFEAWPERVLAAADVQPGDKVLDVACGTGILARKAAEFVGPDGSVVGVDVNSGMLAVAERLGPEIEWKTGAAELLPFEDNSFVKIVSQFGLMFFEDQVKAIREMKRVVRSGGTIAVAVWDSLAATPGYAAVAEILDELFGAEAANSIQAPYSLGDKEKLRVLFVEAGLPDVTIHTKMGTARFDSIETWMYTDIKGWTLADIIDEEGYQRLRSYAPQKLGRFVQAGGTVDFDSPAHIAIFPS
jgi:ubiquinone/menaquinone biosynthesis C-methylase UbiE